MSCLAFSHLSSDLVARVDTYPDPRFVVPTSVMPNGFEPVCRAGKGS